MDENLRELEKQAKTGDSLSFQKFVLEECRIDKHFYELEKIEYPAILENEFEKRYKHLFLNITPPPNIWQLFFNIDDIYRKQCIWCKQQKMFVEWRVEGRWGSPGDYKWTTTVKKGTIVV